MDEVLVETYARQLLNSESNLTLSDDIMQTAQTFVSAMDSIQARDRVEMWSVPLDVQPYRLSRPTSSNSFRSKMGTLASNFRINISLSLIGQEHGAATFLKCTCRRCWQKISASEGCPSNRF